MTNEERREHAERLHAMSEDDGETWDLSDNDQRACAAGAAALDAQAQPAEDRAAPREGLREAVAAGWDDGVRFAAEALRSRVFPREAAREACVDRVLAFIEANDAALRAPAEAPQGCRCGHAWAEHGNATGCLVRGCDCAALPAEAPQAAQMVQAGTPPVGETALDERIADLSERAWEAGENPATTRDEMLSIIADCAGVMSRLRAQVTALGEAQAQREGEIRRLSRIASNHEAQWRYMVDEISRATGVDYDTPADAVAGVRALFALADDLKKQQARAALSPAGTGKEGA